MKNKVTSMINVQDNKIGILRVNNIDYISITDLAKYQNSEDPSFVIKDWVRRIKTIEYIGLWEQLNNPNFNLGELHQIKNEYSTSRFYMSVNQWIKRVNAIGIKASAGRYSTGTFAHPDIAFEFASWMSPEFKLYLITEFERLKKNESYQNKVEWSVRRMLASTNYRVHTDSIKENIVPVLKEKQTKFIYANEADVLNVALFGMTAKEWRDSNSKLEGNIRDYASILQLVVLINLENLNANMIENNISQKDRLEKLNEVARKQLITLNSNNVKKIEEYDKNYNKYIES